MGNTFNRLVSIDNECKKFLGELKIKQNNVENFVNERAMKRKDIENNDFKFNAEIRKNEYETQLANRITQIEIEKKQGLDNIKEKYDIKRTDIVNEFFRSVID